MGKICDLSKAGLRKVQVKEIDGILIIIINDRFIYLAKPY